jgi:adenylate cyclase
LQANSSLSSLYFIAAAALALGGCLEAARAWADQGLKMEPGFRCKLFSELMSPQVANRLAEGGRILSLPS